MHNNHYFLRQLSSRLRKELAGATLTSCFSQTKDELILEFSNNSHSFYIRAYLLPDFSCLAFPSSFARARKNTADLFPEIIEKAVSDIIQFENERAFAIRFEDDYSLVFKLFGNRSNVILFHQNENKALFKNNLILDRNIRWEGLHRRLDQRYETFVKAEGNFQKVFPTFGPLIKEYLSSKDYEILSLNEKWELVQNVKQILEHPQYYYVALFSKTPGLSLLNIGNIIHSTESPFDAINFFFQVYTKTFYLEKEKNLVVSKLNQQITGTVNYLKKVEERLMAIKEGIGYDKLADILMANLYQVPPKATEVELYNFYENAPVTIKLNPSLSPQKNAENFYRKSKNQKIEIENIEKNIDLQRKRQKALNRYLEDILNINSIKELQRYTKEHQIDSEKAEAQKILPFKHVEVDNFQILIGKNAKNNDLLTQKYAYKEDLWLHAKDVTGSHVIIKYQSGRNFPKPVIEKAAQLAAYYSQRKTDTLCPVIVTPKKFVRKPKGAAPGAVVVEKEKVMLVKPLSLQDYSINE